MQTNAHGCSSCQSSLRNNGLPQVFRFQPPVLGSIRWPLPQASFLGTLVPPRTPSPAPPVLAMRSMGPSNRRRPPHLHVEMSLTAKLRQARQSVQRRPAARAPKRDSALMPPRLRAIYQTLPGLRAPASLEPPAGPAAPATARGTLSINTLLCPRPRSWLGKECGPHQAQLRQEHTMPQTPHRQRHTKQLPTCS